jgi:tetratricopeptide (TPR) repeat protein
MIGTQVARYRILSRIGAGGMGEVYLAHDPALDRRAALKFLQADPSQDSDARRRLLTEAQAAARLDHPFVCKVYEVAESHDPPFMAMEYVEGTTLRDRLRAGPLPLKETVRIGSEIAEALDFAHNRGLVHRDLTPANVMLATDGHVKVMDFGLARDVAPGNGLTMTATGQIAGTPAYMSPEQLRGERVDRRSDVFAFGVLLYEMAAGAHPFSRTSTFSTANAILNETPVPLDERLETVPPLFAHIVRRCLEKDPESRYQSLRDVHIELSTAAQPFAQSSGRSAPALPRRVRSRWALAAALAGLVATGALLLWMWPERFGLAQPALAFNARDWIVVSDFENMTGDQVFDRSLRVAAEVGVSQSQYVNVFPPQRLQLALQRMQRPAGERLDETLASEVAVREGIKAVLAGTIAQVGDSYTITARLVDPQSKTALLSESVQARDKASILPALDELLTTLRRRLGESLASTQTSVPLPMATTSSLDALQMYAESFRFGPTTSEEATAYQLLQQAIALDPEFALAHAELGRRYYLENSQADRLLGEEHFTTAIGLLNRLTLRERLWIQATADDSRGNRQRAVDAYRAYLAQYRDDSRAWFRLGWTHMAGLGQYEQAVEAFERVIQLVPTDAAAHVNLASSFSGLRKYREAVEAYDKAFGFDPALRTGVFVNHEYGMTLVQLGEFDKAAEAFTIMKSAAEPANRSRGHRSQAFLDMYRGRYDAAIKELGQAVLINQTIGAGISEFRDRTILVSALDAKSLSAPAAAELDAVGRLIDRLTLGPEWLRRPVKILARRGRVREARRLLDSMQKTAGSAVVDSTTNRNIDRDRAYIDLARGEIALAEQRPGEAVKLLQAASLGPFDADILESLATAHVAAGQLDLAAQTYEQVLARPALGQEAQEHWVASHVALGQIYERLGRHDDARRLYTRVQELWKDADNDLVTLKRANQLIASR